MMAAFLPLLGFAPRGDGQPVLVLPGFLCNDAATAPLRRYLSHLGYQVHGWELGRNLGLRTTGSKGGKLLKRLDALHAQSGEKVSVVGWSLGGMMARQIARARPGKVRQVITLGSPIAGAPYDNNIWPLIIPATAQKPTHDHSHESQISHPVPSSAIYSEEDGVVAAQNCREVAGPCNESIRVYGSHLGLAANPMVLLAIADRLAQRQGEWKSFADSEGWKQQLYPSPSAR